MFAIISNKGDQYRVYEGKECTFDLGNNDHKAGDKIDFNEILLISDDKKVTVGTPFIDKASVSAEVILNGQTEKTSALKFHSKKRYTRNLGHRQKFTKVKIVKISLKNEK